MRGRGGTGATVWEIKSGRDGGLFLRLLHLHFLPGGHSLHILHLLVVMEDGLLQLQGAADDHLAFTLAVGNEVASCVFVYVWFMRREFGFS